MGYYTIDGLCKECVECGSGGGVIGVIIVLVVCGLIFCYCGVQRHKTQKEPNGATEKESPKPQSSFNQLPAEVPGGAHKDEEAQLMQGTQTPPAEPESNQELHEALDPPPESNQRDWQDCLASEVKLLWRASFQPLRCLVTYAQVTSQMGPVLRVTFPESFSQLVNLLTAPFNFWERLFDLECANLGDFASMWLLQVVFMPLILLALALVYWAVRTWRGAKDANATATTHAFLAIFVCYPPICNMSRTL
jgi:uncharacterized membrane protein